MPVTRMRSRPSRRRVGGLPSRAWFSIRVELVEGAGEHILDAIRAGHAGAEAAMLDHIDRSRDRSEGARVRSETRPT
jgi:hypothetical protein